MTRVSARVTPLGRHSITTVTRSALENAASIAAALLATETLITDRPDTSAGMAMPGGKWEGFFSAMKKEAENERIILAGQSKGVKRHNRRAKALLARAGLQRPTVGQTRAPVAP